MTVRLFLTSLFLWLPLNADSNFVLILQDIQDGTNTVTAKLVCADYISRAECLRDAYKAKLLISRASGKFDTEWAFPKLSENCSVPAATPSGSAAVPARKSKRVGFLDCTSGSGERGTLFVYYLALPLTKSDQVKIQYISGVSSPAKIGTLPSDNISNPNTAAGAERATTAAWVTGNTATATPAASPVALPSTERRPAAMLLRAAMPAQPARAAASTALAPAAPLAAAQESVRESRNRAMAEPGPAQPAQAQPATSQSAGAAAKPMKLTDPKDQVIVMGKTNITATAPSGLTVTSVQFRLDGEDLDNPESGPPFVHQWDTSGSDNGDHKLTAVGKDKNGTATAESDAVTVTVKNTQITAPATGTTIAGVYQVTATGVDKAGTVTQFKLDAADPPDSKDSTGNLNPAVNGSSGAYTTSWDTTKAANGPHTISAITTDSAGNRSIAATVKFVVKNAPTISAVSAASPQPTTNSATITWITDKPSTGQVFYGPTNTYGSQTELDQEQLIPGQAPACPCTHSAPLSQLTAAATYHYQVGSQDAEGNLSKSDDATFVAQAAAPDEVPLLTEGSTKVSGTFRDSKPAKARVEVRQGGGVVEYQEVAVASDTGAFTVALNSPLSGDDQVVVSGVDSTGRSGLSQTYGVTPSVLDWGRVRAYFTFGMLLSSNQTASGSSGTTSNAFNSNGASPYLAFDVDNNWLRPTRNTFWQRFRLNTVFDARLTQIGTAAAGTTQGSSATNAPPSITGFLANKQAGAVQGGVYIPVVLASWDHGGNPYALYLGPVAETGFYTTSGAFSNANVTNLSGTSFYKFWGYGVRLGLLREHEHWNGFLRSGSAPESLIQLDLLKGRWGNFEYVSPMTSLDSQGKDTSDCNMYQPDPTKAQCFLRERLWRYAFDGLVNIPHTPFVVGFSANVSGEHARGPNSALAARLKLPPVAPGYNFIAPPDDLRFLFGLRLDAKTLLGTVVKSPQ